VDFDFVQFIERVEKVGAKRASLELARDLLLITHKAHKGGRARPRREIRHG
jgi:hypothetical protein